MQLDEAYQQQLGHWRATLHSGAGRIGWKIGLNVPTVQEKLGIDRSVVGHLTTATLLGADGAHSLAGAEKPMAEPEIAIEVGADGTIAGLAPAIEVADIDRPLEDVGQIVAANIFHRAVAIGPSADLGSAEGIEAVLRINGEQVARADAGSTNLAATIALVDETLRDAGESLQAGDRIIAGSLTPPAPIGPGDRAEVDLGPVGRLEVSFS
jgi:2-keto-4-pentenoate hydratase